MDKKKIMPNKVWEEITNTFSNLHRLSLGMDKQFHLTLYTLYNWWNYLSMIRLTSIKGALEDAGVC